MRTHTRRRRRQRRPAVSVEMKVGGGSPIGGGDELVDVALWMLFRRGPRTRRDQPQSTLFRFQRFATRTTLHGEIVVGERGLSIMGLWLKVADQNLLEADFTRVLSDPYQPGRPRIPHPVVAPTSTCRPNPRIKAINTPQSGIQTLVTLRSRQPKA